ncbi:ABC transporter substrate-binding protein [Kitasatospora sp. NBC_00315]|uniref:ABC transporter substrate-binding protein n=1 Tax=Kitasatospora sp. NBC_00315 TaxID=2975963 RepID=UPI003246166E
MGPTSRRRTLAVAALLAAATTACSSTAGPAAGAGDAAAGKPVTGGTLTFALHGDTDCLDPHLTGSSVSSWIGRNNLDSLVGQSLDNRTTPWLASSWDVSADGLSYTFHLRGGVTFTDGTPLDAAAVKANLDLIADPATKSSYARSLLGPYAGSEVADPATLTVRLSAPFTSFLQGLSTPFLGIASPTFLKAHAADSCTTGLVGSGPFKLDSYTRGQGASFSRNAAYAWGPGYAAHTGAAYLDKLELKIVTESSVRDGGLFSGQFDGVANVAPSDLTRVSKDPKLQLLKHENPGVNHVLLLNTARAPFDSLQVRQAFQSSIDVKSTVQSVFFGQTSAADGLFGKATEYYDSSVQGLWGFDRAKAGALLDQAGWTARDGEGYRTKDGRRLSVSLVYSDISATAEEQTIFQAAAQQAKESGFEVKLDKVAAAAESDRQGKGDYDIGALYFVRAEPDIARTVFAARFTPPAGANLARVNDPVLEDLLAKGLTLPEGAERAKVYADVQQRIIGQAYAVPTYVPFGRLGAVKAVHGLGFATNSAPLFYDVWKS